MASWQRHIYLQPEWEQAQEDEISIQELAAVIAKRLKALAPFIGADSDLEDKKEDLIYEFEGMSKDENLTTDEFDGWMGELYDWGDIQISGKFFDAKKVCWIDTTTNRETADA